MVHASVIRPKPSCSSSKLAKHLSRRGCSPECGPATPPFFRLPAHEFARVFIASRLLGKARSRCGRRVARGRERAEPAVTARIVLAAVAITVTTARPAAAQSAPTRCSPKTASTSRAAAGPLPHRLRRPLPSRPRRPRAVLLVLSRASVGVPATFFTVLVVTCGKT